MVLLKIVQEAIRFASKYGRQTVDVDYKILRGVGYKHAAARGVSHGIFAGTAGNYLKDDNGIEPDAKVPFKRDGFKASKSNQARSGYKRYNSRSRGRKFRSCNCKRYSNSGSYKFRRNRM